MRSQRTIISIAAIALVIVVIAVVAVLHVTQGSSSGGDTSFDPALKSTADRMAPTLNNPGGKLPVQDATLNSWKAWVYDVQADFANITAHQRGAQYEQIYFSDPSVMPPQGVIVNEPTHPQIAVDGATITKAIQTGQGQYTTIHTNSHDIRVYVTPLRVPELLTPAGVTGVLEVLQQQT